MRSSKQFVTTNVGKLREAEVLLAEGMKVPEVVRRLGGEIDVAKLLTACLEGGLFSTLSRVS